MLRERERVGGREEGGGREGEREGERKRENVIDYSPTGLQGSFDTLAISILADIYNMYASENIKIRKRYTRFCYR